MIFFAAILVAEIFYLAIDVDIGENVTLSSNQYWALALPVLTFTVLLSLLGFWIGFTMMVSKAPIKMTYDSAYEEAAGELEISDK
ncbi:MAG: hypothetical protein IH840_00310 [Candidatus Heimdallarchaeota archaeon]|nr:hypothetical protein [Candidatus Heimdallarchaeota archaeon]